MVLQGFKQGLESREHAENSAQNQGKKKKSGVVKSMFGVFKNKKSPAAANDAASLDSLVVTVAGSPEADTSRLRAGSSAAARSSMASMAHQDEEMVQTQHQIFILALTISVSYISLGTLVFCLWENWSFADGLYFTVVTLTTVGYGDQDGWTSDGAMFFCTVYALVGILLLGTALGIIAAEVLQANDDALDAVKSLALEIQEETKELLRDNVSNDSSLSQPGRAMGQPTQSLREWYKKNTSEITQMMLPSIFTLVVVLGMGMVFIKLDQNELNFIECLYYAVITSTTIGYGDISPVTNTGKLFGALYLLVGVTAVGNVLSNIAGFFIDQKAKAAMEKVLAKRITRADFEAFDIDGDGRIEKTEFALRKLMLMGLIKASDVDRVEKEFAQMDTDGSGEITMEDLDLFLAKQEELREKNRRASASGVGSWTPESKSEDYATDNESIMK
jgi:potassium channel subfamily K